MDPELVNYINFDLKWSTVKKGRRSMTRRLKKPGADALKLCNKIQDLPVSETKPGVDVIGQHFLEKLSDAPLKKRRLLHQSPSQPPQTPCLPTPILLHEDSARRFQLTSPSKSQETKSKTGPMIKVPHLDDFSGIELLAAAACSSFIHENADHVVEEHTTPGVNSGTFDTKQALVSTESDGSLVKEHAVPKTQDNGHEEGEKKVAPSKDVRLHWDLNTVMDDWEEPCENCSENVYNNGLKIVELNTHSEIVVGAEDRTVLDESSASKSDVVDSLIHPGKCEDLSTSPTSALQIQTIIKGEPGLLEDSLAQKSDQQPVSEVMQGGCQSSDKKFTSEDPLSDCCGSNVTQDEQGHKAQTGYDSPFEDGELREPNVWGKRETLDYESDNIYEDDFGTVEYPLPEKLESSHEHDQSVEDRSSFTVKEVEEKLVKNRRLEALPKNEIEESAKTETHSKLSSKESDCRSAKIFTEIKSVHEESRTFRGNSLHIDGSLSFDVCRNSAYIRQNRFCNMEDSYSRGRRDKVSFQTHTRNDPSCPPVDPSTRIWDSKSSQGYHRPKNPIVDSFPRHDGSKTYNPRDSHRTFNSKPSPSERNTTYTIHKGPATRTPSHNSTRVGPRYHSQEHHDPDACYLERKTRRFSPTFNRPMRRSRSRSRSGSPIAWNFQTRKKSFFDERKVVDKKLEIHPRKLKPDDHFKHPRRFAHVKEHKFNDDDNDVRKYDDRYDTTNRVRRFRYDSFEDRRYKDSGGTVVPEYK